MNGRVNENKENKRRGKGRGRRENKEDAKWGEKETKEKEVGKRDARNE